MTRLPVQEFAAFIGLDWADATHAICLQAAGSNTRESSMLEHTPEAIDAWARALRSRFGGQPIAVCLDGPNLAKTKILAKYNTVSQVDRLHGGTQSAQAARE